MTPWTLPEQTLLDRQGPDPGPPPDLSAPLAELLHQHRYKGTVSSRQVGPRVVSYRYDPMPGERPSLLRLRVQDLAVGLQVAAVRLRLQRGVYLEIPRPQPDTVALAPLLQDTRNFTVALGRTVDGQPLLVDLTTLPHLLVAGATGSGKSVYLHALLLSLLLRQTPEQLRLVLVDPKRLEFSPYHDIPHLCEPVLHEPMPTIRCLQLLNREMDRRYAYLASVGHRSVEEHNPWPRLVVVIDEAADILLSCQLARANIIRLGQMGRASGIHIILATQRPSIQVVTGLIKANFPARIAFRVPTGTDSRVILDQNGAESLLGNGDGLLVSPSYPMPIRFQAPLVTPHEVDAVANAWRKQKPNNVNVETKPKYSITYCTPRFVGQL